MSNSSSAESPALAPWVVDQSFLSSIFIYKIKAYKVK